MKIKITNKISTPILVFLALILFGAMNIKAAPGNLDRSFGSGGIVNSSFSSSPYTDFPRSMRVQPDGKIVVCGRVTEYDPQGDDQIIVSFFITRYRTDGTLDISFGTNGTIMAPISSGYELVGEEIALQPDGKIVAVGFRHSHSGDRFAVSRYNSDGTLDATFGTGGKVTTQVGNLSRANSVAVQQDGKIVVIGYSFFPDPNFAVVRYNSNGTLDTAFGVGGQVITQLGYYSRAETVMLQSDGKIVVAGDSDDGSGGYSGRFALVRYNADGSLDSHFGVDGIVLQTFPNSSLDLKDAVLQPDGRIVVAGIVFSINQPAMAIVRYNANGSIDTSFAAKGIFTSPNTVFAGDGIALQPDGKIVSFGSYYYARSAVLRLNPNGSLDTGFGSNGRAVTNFANGTSYGVAGAIQPNGRILFLGYNWIGGDVVIARFRGDPPPLNANGKIAFTSDRDGNLEIYIMNSNGTQQVRLTNNTDTDCLPAFSPDGRKIDFVSQQTVGSLAANIKIMNADGTNQTELTPITFSSPFPWHEIRSLSWSPDGRKIAFDDAGEIFTINVDGSNRTNLTNHPGDDFAPAWSPDGSRILFVSERTFEGWRLHTMNADGSDVQQLPRVSGMSDRSPEWSPTGNQIAFIVNYEDELRLPAIYTANADGTNRQLFDGCTGSCWIHRNKPNWSPDATKIAFHIWDYLSDDCEIYAKNVAGGSVAQLTDTVGHNFQPSWQPRRPRISPLWTADN